MTVVLMMVNVQVVLNGGNLGGGGGCWKFESFVGNLGSFAPPPHPPPKKSEFPPLVVLMMVVLGW